MRLGVRNEKRSARARVRGPHEPQRYQTGDLNAYDTLYRSVLPEDPNLSTPKFCARSGVTDCVLFCHGTCPVRLDTGTLGHCQPPRNARISMTVTFCCTGLADSGAMPPMKCWEIVADKLSAAGCVVKERLKTEGGVLDAGCEAQKRVITLSGVAIGIASVRRWINRSHSWRKRKQAEHEEDDRKAAPQRRPAD